LIHPARGAESQFPGIVAQHQETTFGVQSLDDLIHDVIQDMVQIQ